MEPSISLRDVWLEYPIHHVNTRSLKAQIVRLGYRGKIAQQGSQSYVLRAIQGVSLDFKPGDRIGLMGRNGSGKTTLLKLLAGIFEPTRGTIERHGKISSLLNISLGLDEDQTGLENIVIGGMMLGKSRREMLALAPEIGDFTELGPYLAMPMRTYSAGMRTRLAFATATCIEPEIFLVDEVMGAGDWFFANKAQKRIEQLAAKVKIMVLATHSQPLMESFCDHAILMQDGAILCQGPVAEVFDIYHGRAPAPGPEAGAIASARLTAAVEIA